MSENLGIVRNKEGLEFTLLKLTEIENRIPPDTTGYYHLKIQNLITVCRLITKSALTREESRGGHIREDFQKENLDFKVHIIQQKEKNIQFEPVRK